MASHCAVRAVCAAGVYGSLTSNWMRVKLSRHDGEGRCVFPATDAATDLRVLLATILAGAEPLWCAVTTEVTHELVKCAHQEGVLALVDKRLRELPAGDLAAPPKVRQAFLAATRSEALSSMLLQAEALRVLSLMAEAGIPGLLLKGSALAYWAYSQPHLRACSDVDLLLPSREAAEQLSDRLTASGYERSKTSGELVAYELLCRRSVSDDWQIEIDIHWRLANSPLFANVFTFDELMADSVALPNLAPNARGLGPVHALIHACVHRALNLSIGVGDKLKWQYDLELVRANFTPADWRRLVDLSIRKGLAGVVLDALGNAARTFESQLPHEWTTALARAGSAETLDARRLSDWRYMQHRTFKSLPTAILKLRWLWQRVFPSIDYLRHLYGTQHKSYCYLILLRSRQVFKLLKR